MMPEDCNVRRALRALHGYGRLTPWHGVHYTRSYEAAQPQCNSTGNHWSSTENSANNSWNVNFNSGNSNNNNKYNANVVRPAVAHPTKAWLQLRRSLQEAYADCRRGKSSSQQFQDYISIANEDLDLLTTQLMERTYQPSTSTCFLVRFPKLREVFAAAFRDRIIHHWICLRLNPLFEQLNRYLGDVTHNCRVGFGTKSAVDAVYQSIKEITYDYGRDAYIFKGDLVGFFMSLPQRRMCDKLKEFAQKQYRHDFKDLLLWLIEVVVMHRPELNCMFNSDPKDWKGLAPNKSLFRSGEGLGSPIGNLTTQLFANFYMTEFDECMVAEIERLKAEENVTASFDRFVDDFIIVCNSKKHLKQLVRMADEKLTAMGLKMHKDKRYCQPANHGVLFVGSYIKNGRVYLSNRTVGRFRNLVVKITKQLDCPDKEITSYDRAHILASLNSYLGFCKGKRTYRLRCKILEPLMQSKQFCKYFSINENLTKVNLNFQWKTIIR